MNRTKANPVKWKSSKRGQVFGRGNQTEGNGCGDLVIWLINSTENIQQKQQKPDLIYTMTKFAFDTPCVQQPVNEISM